MNNQPTQIIANQAEIISNLFAGYGHRTITILVDGTDNYTYTTNAMHITDNLGDDDMHEDATERLIDSCLQHAAAAMDLPSNVFWIGTSAKNFGYSIHKNIEANPPSGNVKLIGSYLFDYSFEGATHECPYMDLNEIFDVEKVVELID